MRRRWPGWEGRRRGVRWRVRYSALVCAGVLRVAALHGNLAWRPVKQRLTSAAISSVEQTAARCNKACGAAGPSSNCGPSSRTVKFPHPDLKLLAASLTRRRGRPGRHSCCPANRRGRRHRPAGPAVPLTLQPDPPSPFSSSAINKNCSFLVCGRRRRCPGPHRCRAANRGGRRGCAAGPAVARCLQRASHAALQHLRRLVLQL